MAIDSNGLVYVGTQSGGAALAHVYNQNGTEIGSIGGGSPEVYGLGFLKSGELLVTEYYNRVVDLYSPGGSYDGGWSIPGSRALFMALDDQDNIFITDDTGDQIRKFTSSGTLLAQWATPHPAGVVFLNGLVYVAGMYNGIMSIYAPDGTPAGSFPTGCTWAEQLSVDASGNLLLADHGLHQLKSFSPGGTLFWTIGPNVPGYEPGTCDFFSVAPGMGNTILAGDLTNRRILVLGWEVVATKSSSWGRVKATYR
jgi:sugar lactone lactonase YvrE